LRSRPHDIRFALGSPQAVRLLDVSRRPTVQHRLLQLAIAVHRTADEICQAGWTATDDSVIDLELLSYSGQTENQQFVVGLLASYLHTAAPAGLEFDQLPATPCSRERLVSLIELCSSVSPTERAGALRLLGDEALFTSSMFPAIAHRCRVDSELLEALRHVLPRAVLSVLDDLVPELNTLLDVHLMFGPVWYRMAARNLLYNGERETLNNIAGDFVTARRFIVRVAQGPMAALKDHLYPEIV
jgi:hypothetical protein